MVRDRASQRVELGCRGALSAVLTPGRSPRSLRQSFEGLFVCESAKIDDDLLSGEDTGLHRWATHARSASK